MATSTEYQRKQAEWLQKKLDSIRSIKEPTDLQRLFLTLAENPRRTSEESKNFDALLRAEKAQERAETARIAARAIVTDQKSAEKKARDHEMYEAAGLMGMAGLLDTKTGKLNRSRAAILGALHSLAEVDDSRRWEGWAAKGDAIFTEHEAAKKKTDSGSRKKDGGEVDTSADQSEIAEQTNYG